MQRTSLFSTISAFLTAVTLTATAQAQTYCLQYPVYEDESGVYLYVEDEYYDSNTPDGCQDFDGEYYLWDPPVSPLPQTCGNCEVSLSTAARVKDKNAPLPAPVPKDYVFGTKPNASHSPLNPVGGLNPTAGISSINKGIVWIKGAPGDAAIPIVLYRAYLDYQAAGASEFPCSGRIRGIFVGFEVENSSTPTNVVTPTLIGNEKYRALVNVTEKNGEVHTYHIITSRPLQ